MDTLGPGACVEESTAWIENRVRLLSHALDSTGGYFPGASIRPQVLNYIRTRHTGTLAYDVRTGYVFSRMHGLGLPPQGLAPQAWAYQQHQQQAVAPAALMFQGPLPTGQSQPYRSVPGMGVEGGYGARPSYGRPSAPQQTTFYQNLCREDAPQQSPAGNQRTWMAEPLGSASGMTQTAGHSHDSSSDHVQAPRAMHSQPRPDCRVTDDASSWIDGAQPASECAATQAAPTQDRESNSAADTAQATDNQQRSDEARPEPMAHSQETQATKTQTPEAAEVFGSMITTSGEGHELDEDREDPEMKNAENESAEVSGVKALPVSPDVLNVPQEQKMSRQANAATSASPLSTRLSAPWEEADLTCHPQEPSSFDIDSPLQAAAAAIARNAIAGLEESRSPPRASRRPFVAGYRIDQRENEESHPDGYGLSLHKNEVDAQPSKQQPPAPQAFELGQNVANSSSPQKISGNKENALEPREPVPKVTHVVGDQQPVAVNVEAKQEYVPTFGLAEGSAEVVNEKVPSECDTWERMNQVGAPFHGNSGTLSPRTAFYEAVKAKALKARSPEPVQAESEFFKAVRDAHARDTTVSTVERPDASALGSSENGEVARSAAAISPATSTARKASIGVAESPLLKVSESAFDLADITTPAEQPSPAACTNTVSSMPDACREAPRVEVAASADLVIPTCAPAQVTSTDDASDDLGAPSAVTPPSPEPSAHGADDTDLRTPPISEPTQPGESVSTSPQSTADEMARSEAQDAANSRRSSNDGAMSAPIPVQSARSDSNKAHFVVIHDEASMEEAIMQLSTEMRDNKGGEKGAAGYLRRAYARMGPVAMRLDGCNVGRMDGIVSTVQIAGAGTLALVFDVILLRSTPQGRAILEVELLSLLADAKIRKVMHDVHDQAVALARLFHGLPLRLTSLLDLQLVQESLSGYPHIGFSECLWSFGVCEDPSRKFSMDEEASVARPLPVELLQTAADAVIHLRQACLLAQKALVTAGHLARVFRASKEEAEFAVDAKCNGWRRMSCVHGTSEESGVAATRFASYELEKARARSTGHGLKLAREGSKCNRQSSLAQADLTSSRVQDHGLSAPPCDSEADRQDDEDGVRDEITSPQRSKPPHSDLQFEEARTSSSAHGGAIPPGQNSAKNETKVKIAFGDFGSDLSPSPSSSPPASTSMLWLDDGERSEPESKTPHQSPSPSSKAASEERRLGSPPETSRGGGGFSEEGTGAQSDEDGPTCVDDVLEMLKNLPKILLRGALASRDVVDNLEEIILDQGTRPRALVKGVGKVYLCEDKDILVTRYHINCAVGRLEHQGLFDADNRAGFDGLLHRVSVMRDKNGHIYGATIRMKTFSKGCANTIADTLTASPPGPRAPCILVLGQHGAGKTTLVRDICRRLSKTESVVIVDTTNEIGGEGTVPHREAIGESRRIMVAPDDEQHSVMQEAASNHHPETLVVDELSSQQDVETCAELKARGLRVVAGAVGDLPSVLDSAALSRSLGGLEPALCETEYDVSALDNINKLWSKERRSSAPVFDTVIQVEGGEEPTYTVAKRVDVVVDELLEKGFVRKPEIRAPLPMSGEVDEESNGDIDAGRACAAFLLKIARDPTDRWVW